MQACVFPVEIIRIIFSYLGSTSVQYFRYGSIQTNGKCKLPFTEKLALKFPFLIYIFFLSFLFVSSQKGECAKLGIGSGSNFLESYFRTRISVSFPHMWFLPLYFILLHTQPLMLRTTICIMRGYSVVQSVLSLDASQLLVCKVHLRIVILQPIWSGL